MCMRKYYLDTCIWLSLLKKEELEEKQEWEEIKKFITKILLENGEIYYAGITLKELKIKGISENYFKNKLRKFEESSKLIFANSFGEDYDLARKFERELNYKIGFGDLIILAICIRLELILVTKDIDLMKFARKHVEVLSYYDLFT